jgi:hypothetical protein
LNVSVTHGIAPEAMEVFLKEAKKGKTPEPQFRGVESVSAGFTATHGTA